MLDQLLEHALVFVPIGFLLWGKYVLPVGIAGGIICMAGRGVWYLLRKNLYDELDRQQEIIGDQTQQLKRQGGEQNGFALRNLRVQLKEMEGRCKNMQLQIAQLTREKQEMEQVHQTALKRARNNASNTGMFKGYTGALSAQALPAKAPPPPPSRKRPAPPPLRRATSSQ